MKTLVETKQALDAGEVTSEQLVEDSLAAIEQHEPKINAFTEVLGDEARAAAKEWDSRRDQAKETALGGVPIGVKDVICTTEGHTQAASNMLRGFASPHDATGAARLKEQGGIVIGKLNCDAFAMGVSTEYSDFGATKNPWDTSRVPGGSSGGSAAAIAAGELSASLGTDTGGSVRHPSSFCNTVGLRPTYGRISRFGLLSYGSSMDQLGPVTQTVEDAALLLGIMAGHDQRDATSAAEPVGNYQAALKESITGLKIGVPKEYFDEGIASEVTALVRAALREFEMLGAELIDISLPLTPMGVPVYYLIAKAEGSTNLGRYDAIRYGTQDVQADALLEHYIEARGTGFGPEVKRTILMGTYALSSGYYDAWYKQASKVRTLIRREFETAFGDVDVIAGPTTPTPAFGLGEKADDPLAMYLEDALVVGPSLAGVPALSIPAGFSDGLPVGMQLIAPHFQEERLFQVGHAYQQATDWHTKRPSL